MTYGQGWLLIALIAIAAIFIREEIKSLHYQLELTLSYLREAKDARDRAVYRIEEGLDRVRDAIRD
jgi:hypothetical protein